MNVLITPDVPDWAIGNLTNIIVKNNPRFNFNCIYVHPRGVTESLRDIQELLRDKKIDLWHAQYWRSATQLMEYLPELKEVPSILTHYNHHCLEKEDWKDFNALVEMTDWGVDILRKKHSKVFKIPLGIDLDKFSYIEEYPPKEPKIGYVGRVVPWKNLDKICDAANKLKYKVIGSGYIDNYEYWQSIDKSNLEYNGNIGRNSMPAENFKNELYRQMTVFVMYSTGEKESGTLPFLEAMARGIPVLATEQGMARDLIKDGENGVFFNEDNFEEKLKMVMEDEELRKKLRKNAWETIRGFSDEHMARETAKMYYKVLYPKHKLISVIIPTFNRPESLVRVVMSVETQGYPAKEIIICDDGSDNPEVAKSIELLKKRLKTPILWLKTGNKLDYGLAEARNNGAIEALGEILLFLDDRYELQEGCLDVVAKNVHSKNWNFGLKIINGKPSTKKSFMENFSWLRRKDFMNGGMFCERINMYGGMSQEIRTRYNRQGFLNKQIKEAKVKQIQRSGSKHRKKEQIWKMKYLLHKMYEN